MKNKKNQQFGDNKGSKGKKGANAKRTEMIADVIQYKRDSSPKQNGEDF